MSQSSDVIVVGGGMVGAMTALAFARYDLHVTLVERTLPTPFDAGKHDIRVSAISHATLQMFKSLGAWDEIQGTRVCAYKRMLVWDDSSSAQTRFDSADVGHQQLGYIVENSLIQHALWQQLRSLDNVRIRCPASVAALEFNDGNVKVALENGELLHTQLVVAADGARSSVRTLAGIKVDGESYQQHALVATVNTELPQQDITWQRFTDTGPQAFLPLAGSRASIVWYHTQSRVEALQALPESDFITALEKEFPHQLGRLSAVQQIGSFPLSWSHAKQYVKPRFALVGDAAHSVHPLAGQGVNLGMLDAAVLVQCVTDRLSQTGDTGNLRALRRYERWRKPSNELMIRMLDGIQQVFQPGEGSAFRNGMMKASRTAALQIADKSGLINKACIRTAMGLSGELPELVKSRGIRPGERNAVALLPD